MEELAYAAVIVIVATVAMVVWRREHDVRRAIQLEKEKIEVEERRMFGFLHGLGESLQEDSSPARIHRYIVDGVAEVIGADAGILYLLDADADQLVPVCQSSQTAPVLPLPEEILPIEDPEEAESHYRSYLRLSALDSKDQLLWRVIEDMEPVHVENLGDYEGFGDDPEAYHDGVSLLASPLIYGNKRVGVLAMTQHDGATFSENDREVFQSVAEQSAFALGSAIIHVEAAEKRRMEQELTQASEIQQVLLPRASPELSDYQVAAGYRAARLVSGDYYDYVQVDGDRYGVAIGDVCGKGIAASLIMAMCRSNLRGRAPENLSAASVLHSVNHSIFPDIRGDMFVSLLYLILERGSKEITLARAGHEPPLLYRKASNEIELVETPGMAAGVDEGPVFKRSVKDYRLTMEPGDILLLYTDGLIESESSDGTEFGVERLAETVVENKDACAEELVAAIVAKIGEFSKGMTQIDDITLIAIEKR
ncbi:MAG: GAF domain-containing SpoIIE family protein phosphatase [Verrucomicrobiales bacterium]